MYDRSYAYTKQVGEPVEEAADRVRAALAEEGFGVLTEIDVQATLKSKLDVDRKPYVILGACNPPLADRALQAEPPIGVLLPCNVTVFEGDDGHTYVQAIDPVALFSVIGVPDVQPISELVAEKIRRALDSL